MAKRKGRLVSGLRTSTVNVSDTAAKSRRTLMAASLTIALVAVHPMDAAQNDGERPHVRFKNERIAEVFKYAIKKSPSFEDLVHTLELQDRVVYIEEGECPHPQISSCLQLMSTPGGRYIQIRLDPRQPIRAVVARLAHELYHASEIARHPAVIDAASLRELFEKIGYRNKNCPQPNGCWETRAAVAFEALVTRELNEW